MSRQWIANVSVGAVRARARLLSIIAGLATGLVSTTAFGFGPVKTQSGVLMPAAHGESDVHVFRGISYAAAPVRWKPPQPAPSWKGVRVAEEYGPPCPQGDFPGVADPRPASEDCLSLNIWTPARQSDEKLPVMVWIHGGAFVAGSNTRHDGTSLAKKGVVVVAINYRLGPLGFFAHPALTAESPRKSSGNYALLDCIAALQWVQHNIAAFGGDPAKVTIFGQSAGSELVNILTVSPLAKGLFARAIGESGGSLGWREPEPLAQVERHGVALAARANAADLADLRALPPERLFELDRERAFEPLVDDWIYPVAQRDALKAGLQHAVPMIVGSNADEGQLSSTLTAEKYVENQRSLYGARADEFLKVFPGRSDAEARASAKRSSTLGAEFIEGTIAKEHARKAKTYQYRFIHAPPKPAKDPGYSSPRIGAYHGAELIYVFANLHTDPREWSDADYRLQTWLSSYWVNFARTGDPNGPGLPHWPSVNAAPDKVMEFGEQAQVIDRPNDDLIRFLDEFYYGKKGVYRSDQ